MSKKKKKTQQQNDILPKKYETIKFQPKIN